MIHANPVDAVRQWLHSERMRNHTVDDIVESAVDHLMDSRVAFVKFVLENADAFGWSLQGLGMLRLYITKEIRLHIWDSRYAVKDADRIHDHPWSFVSEIISGSLTNLIFTKTKDAAVTHHEQQIRCGPGGCAVGATKDVALSLVSSERYVGGDSYYQSHDQIHDTEAWDGTVTLVKRTFDREDTEHALVYVPFGKQWGSAEPRPATSKEVSAIVGKALEEWS